MIERTRLSGLPNGGYGLGGSNVVARSPVFFVRGALEIFLDYLLSPRESIASAHETIMSDPRMYLRLCGFSLFQSRAVNPQDSEVLVPMEMCRNRLIIRGLSAPPMSKIPLALITLQIR
jgi:hypothetical protein